MFDVVSELQHTTVSPLYPVHLAIVIFFFFKTQNVVLIICELGPKILESLYIGTH